MNFDKAHYTKNLVAGLKLNDVFKFYETDFSSFRVLEATPIKGESNVLLTFKNNDFESVTETKIYQYGLPIYIQDKKTNLN